MRARRAVALLAAGIVIGCGVLYARRARRTYGEVRMRIDVAPGPEDFVVDANGPAGPRLLISCRERRDPRAQGEIVSVDLSGHRRRDIDLVGRGDRELFPVGISLVERDGVSLLYVVNRPPKSEPSIEVFRVDAGTLRFDSELKDDLLTTPNDVLALPDGTVFVTNDGAGVISGLFRLRRGNVVRYRDGAWEKVARDVALANGLATDGTSLFVAHFAAKKIVAYDLGSLEPSYAIEVDGFPDNLSIEADGRTLDVAIHPSMTRTFLHLLTKRISAPSAYARIEIPTTRPASGVLRATKRIDVRDGNAVSTALVIFDSVYLSQLVDPQILVLDL